MTQVEIEKVAQEVIAGKWGNNNDRVVALTNAGYNYREVQNMVNYLLRQQMVTDEPEIKNQSKPLSVMEIEMDLSKYGSLIINFIN